MEGNYKNVISLGYFCSVAEELERIGLRSCSSPFDWCISDFKGVEMCIRNGFKYFIDYDKLSQNSKAANIYKNEYEIEFFYDFNKYKPLRVQIEDVKQKYERRIEKFYINISEPTLFIRYISMEKGLEELEYIKNNYEKTIQLLRSFNENNNIIFIINKSDYIDSEIIPNLYVVEKDAMDNVARRFLDKNSELNSTLCSMPMKEKEKNLEYYKKKVKHNKYNNMINKLKRTMERIFLKEYVHEKQY